MTLLVDLLTIVVAFVVGYLIRRYFIIESGSAKTNIPFIKDYNLILGSKGIIFSNDKILGVNAHDRHLELGKTFGAFFGAQMQFFTIDPDFIYKICVTDFHKHRNRVFANQLSDYFRNSLMESKDDEWQRSRYAIASVLKQSKLKIDHVYSDFENTIQKMLKSFERRLDKAKENNKVLVMDVFQMTMNFAMDAILKLAYNVDGNIDFDRDDDKYVHDMFDFMNHNYGLVPRLCFLMPNLATLVRPFLRWSEQYRYLETWIKQAEAVIMKEADYAFGRSSNPHEDSTRKYRTIHSLIKSYKREELTKEQLIGNAIFVILAGFATSFETMSALLWNLAWNQHHQDRLREDLKKYGEESEFLQQVISETNRLFPGVQPSRTFDEDVIYKNMYFPKNSYLNVDVYALHRDKDLWGPDAEVWDPDRMEKSKMAKFHPAQFIPFGIGPRNCVGMALAKMEITKFTAAILLKYKFEPVDETPKKYKYLALGTLPYAFSGVGPIPLKVTRAS